MSDKREGYHWVRFPGAEAWTVGCFDPYGDVDVIGLGTPIAIGDLEIGPRIEPPPLPEMLDAVELHARGIAGGDVAAGARAAVGACGGGPAQWQLATPKASR